MNAEVLFSALTLGASVTGGIYALYLFKKSNEEKRQALVLTLYDRLYNDKEARDFLYVVDKGTPEEAAQIKPGGTLEPVADKVLRLLSYMADLVKKGVLKRSDIDTFNYEIDLLLGEEVNSSNNPVMLTYRRHLEKMTDSNTLHHLSRRVASDISKSLDKPSSTAAS